MSVFTGGPYGRLAIELNTLSSLNIEIIIIIIIIIIIKDRLSSDNDHLLPELCHELWNGLNFFTAL